MSSRRSARTKKRVLLHVSPARASLPPRIRTKILDVPAELLDVIFSLLDKGDLWTVIHVSQLLREVGIFPLLSRYGVSRSSVASGVICVSEEACFLVPVIHRVRPICRLTLFSGSQPWIPNILATIPDVTIHFRRHFRRSVTEETDIPKILVTSSRNGTDPVVIVGSDIVRVSRHRRISAVEGFSESTIPSIRLPQLSSLTARGVLRDVLCCLVVSLLAVLVFVVLGFIIVYRSICWLYRYTLQPWDPATRIATDLRSVLRYGRTIRIQTITVPGGAQFTLATFPPHYWLTLHRLPSLSSAQYVALLASLDLKDDLSTLTVRSGCKLQFSALMDFIRRHPSLFTLTLFPDAIDEASLLAGSMAIPGHLTTLIAPAAYIPYILPADRSVAEMSTLYADFGFQLSLALDHVARRGRDTGHHRLKLHLCARRSEYLPWKRDAAARDAEADLPVVYGITHVELVLRAVTASMTELPCWLARRFPDLLGVEIYGLALSDAEQFALAQAVLDARIGGSLSTAHWEGVQFHP
ncbi:hypothetical protein DFH06DRAFT_722921 [Mycena polygramma]|nr:hypothetical protein DFH06DRAFT_722921 [Mycena polygramma]